MNSKQKRTLIAIYTDPVSASLVWKDIESLFVCIGAEVIEGNGSRVRFHKTASLLLSIDRIQRKKQNHIKSKMRDPF